MKTITAFFISLVALTTLAQEQPGAVIPNYAYQYAAKIVCGKPQPSHQYPYQIAAKGSYFTEVNVHNPSRTQGVLIARSSSTRSRTSDPPDRRSSLALGWSRTGRPKSTATTSSAT